MHLEVIAHRGESHDAPENTIAAFQLAWECGADAVELDVHLTLDGQLACIHDCDTLRTAGIKRDVRESTMSELRHIDVGQWKSPRYAGEGIPSLDDALSLTPKGKRILIELKNGPEAVEPAVASIRRSGRPMDQFAIISFNLEACRTAKLAVPEIAAYYLSTFRERCTGGWEPAIPTLIASAISARLDGLDLSQKYPFDSRSVDAVRQSGLELYIWTVDDPIVARRLAGLGIDGITTNRAGELCHKVQRTG